MKSNIFREDNSSKFPALDVLKNLGYKYIHPDAISNAKRGDKTHILTGILERKLKELNSYGYKGVEYDFEDETIEKAIRDIDVPIIDGLVNANEKIYNLLMLGKSYEIFTEDGNKQSFDINYIDWENIENNDFHVTEEYKLEKNKKSIDERHIIPDIVIFINGIPMAVIEAKRPSRSVNEGISQMIRNQKPDYIPDLFKYVQLVMSTNKNEVRYATTGTPKKFWSIWREKDEKWHEEILNDAVMDREVTQQDKYLVSLFQKDRFTELVRFFVVFDRNIKKIARYQQYFGVKAILERVEKRDEAGNRESGVIWHTQGSGKSLTMVMLSKYIAYKYRSLNPKIIVVTDRVNLDDQIFQTFNDTSLRPKQARTGRHLVELINDDGADIITSIVNKFETAAELKEPVTSSDIFIIVDESHRTQYGRMHNKMKQVFPNASYLGFTGTPLMKDEKNTMHKFGDLIEPSYTIADAVEDGMILPLYYEGRMVEQTINQKAIDNNLDIITRNLDEEQKEQVMHQWSQFSRIASSDQRIKLVAFKVYEDYMERLKGTRFNAMLATYNKIDAIRYLEHFNDLGDIKAALIISPPDTREGHDRVDEESEEKQLKFWNKMMDKYGSAEKYESIIKNNFVMGDIDILIVVDKLLTGFDAPRAQVLYVDKPLKEHTLLQAIARVNRLEEGKDRGLIIDFRGLLEELDTAMDMYSGAGLEKFDSKDLKGALHDSMTVISELRQDHSNLVDMFKLVKNSNDSEAYEVLLEDKKTRDLFYENLRKLKNSLDLAITLEKVYNSIEGEIKKYEKDYKFFYELRQVVALRYGDRTDTKDLHRQMQTLMDQNITAEGVSRTTNLVNLNEKESFREEIKRLGSPAAKADAIRSRISSAISQEYGKDPSYYKKFSQMIDETLNKYKEMRISEKEYLEEMYKHFDDFEEKDIIKYPEAIKENGDAKAFYGSIIDIVKEKDEKYNVDKELKEEFADLSLEIKDAISDLTKVDWHNNRDVNDNITQAVEDLTYDFSQKHNLDLSWAEIDIILGEIKKIAYERF